MNTATRELSPHADSVKFSPSDIARFWAKVDKNGPLPDQENPHYAGLDRCWIWTGCVNTYGQFNVKYKHLGSHRASWMITHGEITTENHVLHRCDNPLCVNPNHLFLGDQLSNIADRDAKGRVAKGSNHYSLRTPEKMARGDRNGSRLHPERVARGDRNGSRTKPEMLPRGDDHFARKTPEKLARGDRNGSRTKPEKLLRGEKNRMAKLNQVQIEEIRKIYALGGIRQREIADEYGVAQTQVSRIIRRVLWKHVV